MALQIKLQPDSPVLLNSAPQRQDYYVQIGGLHYIKQTNTFVIPVRYFPDETSARTAPDSALVTSSGLPERVTVMRPLDVLANVNGTAYAALYQLVGEHIRFIAGSDTEVTNV